MRRLRPVALALLLAVPEELPAGDGPDVVLYLVGDAGTKVPEAAVVLGPLAADAARDRARSVIAILGDNLYPAGLPPPAPRTARRWRRASRRSSPPRGPRGGPSSCLETTTGPPGRGTAGTRSGGRTTS